MIGRIQSVEGPNQHGWFTVAINGTKYGTKKSEVADRARQFIGKDAHVEVESKVNGQYTNHYINNVTAASGSGSSGTPGGMSDEDKLRVTRLSAVSSAATLLAGAGVNADALFSLADSIVAYGFRGRPGSTTNQGYENPQPEQASYPTDDIPF